MFMNWIASATEGYSFSESLQNVINDGLPIMVAGMMGIFVVTAVIIAVIALLGRLTSNNGYFTKGVKALFSRKKK